MEKNDSFFIINLVEDKNNNILEMRKRLPLGFLSLFNIDSKIRSLWFPPSGFPFKGETREEAAERIVCQETGYKAKVIRSMKGTTLVTSYISLAHKAFMKILILCELVSLIIDSNWQKPEHIEEIRWINKKDPLKYTLH